MSAGLQGVGIEYRELIYDLDLLPGRLIDETVDGYLRVVYMCDVTAIGDEIQWGLLGPLAALSWLCFQPSSRAFVGLGSGGLSCRWELSAYIGRCCFYAWRSAD